jgi:hypothetical protein
MNKNENEKFDERFSAMSDDDILKIVDDRDGWQTHVYERAVSEAKLRNLLNQVVMPQGLSPAQAVAQSIPQTPAQVLAEVWIDLGLLNSMDSIRDKLILKGLSVEVAKESIKQVAVEKSAMEIQNSEATFKRNIAVFLIGAFVTLITFILSSNGGLYVVAWGAIIFGGYRAYEANANAQKWLGIREAAEKYTEPG